MKWIMLIAVTGFPNADACEAAKRVEIYPGLDLRTECVAEAISAPGPGPMTAPLTAVKPVGIMESED